jgi:signal peptidase II
MSSCAEDGVHEEKKKIEKTEQYRSVLLFRVSVFLIIAVLGTVADLISKYLVFFYLGMPGTYRTDKPELESAYWLWDGILGFQTGLNEGGLFGMGQGGSFIFACLSLVAMIAVLVFLYFIAAKSFLLTVTFGMVTAGILGNCYDRLGLHHLTWHYTGNGHQFGEPVYAVRDWILVMFGSFHYPNFNIADSFLVCAACLLILHSFRSNPAEEKTEKEKLYNPNPS